MLRTLMAVLTTASSLVSVLACRERPANVPEHTERGVHIGFVERGGSATPEGDNDSVYVATFEGSRRLVWVTTEGEQIWQSGELYGASPHHSLVDLNGDGLPDLFWSAVYEEAVSSGIVLRTSSGAREVEIGLTECRPGSVQQEADDVFIILYTIAAHPGGDCEDPIIRLCADMFRMDWPRVYRVEGSMLVEARLSASFYDNLSAEYRRAASDLDSLTEANAVFPGSRETYAVCGTETVARISQLADSAAMLARAYR